jgi:uncharacterized DUF497 family protein
MFEDIQLEWDDDNISHISQHNVDPEEVEDVFSNYFFISKDPESKSNREARYIISGTGKGKYLNVVIAKIKGSRYRPVSAWEMSPNYARSFRRKLKARGIK